MFHSLKPTNEKVNGNHLERTKIMGEIFNLHRFDCSKRQKNEKKALSLRKTTFFSF
ncbi:hypothetical protein RV07_GL000305 [Enterococcus malodoratus]|nr:hypothetical protein RV07_GL000305 [Enterococcus malodoratus]